MKIDWLTIKKDIETLVKKDAFPAFRWEHIERVWKLAQTLCKSYSNINYDALYISTLVHDIGTYYNHRPKEPDKLKSWDHVSYAEAITKKLLKKYNISDDIVCIIIDVIVNHLPSRTPNTNEGIILHDSDLLESVGIIGACRVFYKVGDLIDERFTGLNQSIEWLNKQHDIAEKFLISDSAKEIFKIKLSKFLEFKKHILQEEQITS